jgi:hypothetical protein
LAFEGLFLKWKNLFDEVCRLYAKGTIYGRKVGGKRLKKQSENELNLDGGINERGTSRKVLVPK